MSKSKRRELSLEEQDVLDHGHIRLLICPKDIARCDQGIIEHHYLHNVSLVGEHLRYAFLYKGRWLAVATWSAAAFHIKDRDQFIGWSGEQCRRRRALLANNSRLLVMPECHYHNLISRFMKLMLERLSADWQKRWGASPGDGGELCRSPLLHRHCLQGQRLVSSGQNGGVEACVKLRAEKTRQECPVMEWFIFLAGDLFGKEAIWPIVNHLLENGGFHAEGMEIRNTDPTRQSPSVSFLEFLSDPSHKAKIRRIALLFSKGFGCSSGNVI